MKIKVYSPGRIAKAQKWRKSELGRAAEKKFKRKFGKTKVGKIYNKNKKDLKNIYKSGRAVTRNINQN